MAVDALLAALERDADSEVSRRRTEARERAETIIARAAAAADRRRAAMMERLSLTRRAEVARHAAEATRDLKGRVLRARAELLERVFGQAALRLARIEPGRWLERVPLLVEQTLRYLEPGRAVLVCRPEAEGPVRAAVGIREVKIEVREDAPAGLLGRTADGSVVVDNTLTARLERLRPDLAIRLLARIEGRDHALG